MQIDTKDKHTTIKINYNLPPIYIHRTIVIIPKLIRQVLNHYNMYKESNKCI